MEPYSKCGIEAGITGDPGCYGQLKRVALIPQIALSGAAWDGQEVEAIRHQRRPKSQFSVCCIRAFVCAWKSAWAWQYDVFYLLWISVIFRPAGVSHKASHGPEADSHWHWWTSRQIHFLARIYHQSHTVLELSPPSATVHARLHIRYIKRAASLRSSRPLSFWDTHIHTHTHTHTCMLTCYCSEAPSPPLCVVHAWGCAGWQGRAFISLCWYSAALYPLCQKTAER